jgi:CRP-like cAMP-binding protein
MDWHLGLTAFGWGALSAISLPLGAVLGLWLRPGRRVTSAMMAFGGGALLFALSLELFGVALHHVDQHGKMSIVVMIAGAILGGGLFDLLNQILNNRGAFVRKVSTTKKYVARLKWVAAKKVVRQLANVHIFSDLPAKEVAKIIPHMVRVHYRAGETIFDQDESGDKVFFIVKGEVEIKSDKGGELQHIATLKDNDVFGEMALLLDRPRNAKAVAKAETDVWTLYRADFDQIVRHSSRLQESLSKLLSERLEDLQKKSVGDPQVVAQWCRSAESRLKELSVFVTNEDMQLEVNKVHGAAGGAALAIWLGLAIDGVPESLVIGMLAGSVKGMSLAFIIGVFLANLPEALSSSVGMRTQGMSLLRIMGMWFSITLMTGIGAFLGAVLFPQDLHGSMLYFVKGVEGLAAGAMLTMIAETMLPEAFEQGGAIVGFSTLLGFLAALAVKLI